MDLLTFVSETLGNFTSHATGLLLFPLYPLILLFRWLGFLPPSAVVG
ncbi:MAG: hypothetical protein O7F76_03075 [Planctomycetota bacterium]|nr:hypothetical protein [Planctomycetota bacterium]